MRILPVSKVKYLYLQPAYDWWLGDWLGDCYIQDNHLLMPHRNSATSHFGCVYASRRIYNAALCRWFRSAEITGLGRGEGHPRSRWTPTRCFRRWKTVRPPYLENNLISSKPLSKCLLTGLFCYHAKTKVPDSDVSSKISINEGYKADRGMFRNTHEIFCSKILSYRRQTVPFLPSTSHVGPFLTITQPYLKSY